MNRNKKIKYNKLKSIDFFLLITYNFFPHTAIFISIYFSFFNLQSSIRISSCSGMNLKLFSFLKGFFYSFFFLNSFSIFIHIIVTIRLSFSLAIFVRKTGTFSISLTALQFKEIWNFEFLIKQLLSTFKLHFVLLVEIFWSIFIKFFS